MTRNEAEKKIYSLCKGIVAVMREYTQDPCLSISIALEDGEYISARNAYYDHPFDGTINFSIEE